MIENIKDYSIKYFVSSKSIDFLKWVKEQIAFEYDFKKKNNLYIDTFFGGFYHNKFFCFEVEHKNQIVAVVENPKFQYC